MYILHVCVTHTSMLDFLELLESMCLQMNGLYSCASEATSRSENIFAMPILQAAFGLLPPLASKYVICLNYVMFNLPMSVPAYPLYRQHIVPV